MLFATLEHEVVSFPRRSEPLATARARRPWYTKPVTPSVEQAEEYGDKVLRPHIVLDSELPTVHSSAERSSHAVSALISFVVVEWIN